MMQAATRGATEAAAAAGSAFPWPADRVARYTAYRAAGPITPDGVLDEQSWAQAPRSPRFADLVNGEATVHDTRAAVLWDDENLYVAYWIEEPDVRATLTERDALLYLENDVELFIAGADSYYELEVNALGNIYEAFFVWEDSYARFAGDPAFSREPEQARPFAGNDFRHPRGDRIGFWNFDYPGLQVGARVDGTLNDSSDRDRGWTVELCLPWAGLAKLAAADGRSLPPKAGDVWRMDFSRFNQYQV